MYKTTETVGRIRDFAKRNNIKLTDMLKECDLNKNALSSMQSRGSWLQANSLAKIADYLGCSVDYLLGRTDNPTFGTNDLVYGKENNSTLTTEEQEFINKFNLLTDIDKGRILDRMETMHNAYAAGKPKAIFIAARNENDEKTISERKEKGIVNPEILDNIPTMKEE